MTTVGYVPLLVAPSVVVRGSFAAYVCSVVSYALVPLLVAPSVVVRGSFAAYVCSVVSYALVPKTSFCEKGTVQPSEVRPDVRCYRADAFYCSQIRTSLYTGGT